MQSILFYADEKLPAIFQPKVPPPELMGWLNPAYFVPPDYTNIGTICEKVKSPPKNPFLVLLNTIPKRMDTWSYQTRRVCKLRKEYRILSVLRPDRSRMGSTVNRTGSVFYLLAAAGAFSNSYGPISMPAPWGRGTPSMSILGAEETLPASIAGLPCLCLIS